MIYPEKFVFLVSFVLLCVCFFLEFKHGHVSLISDEINIVICFFWVSKIIVRKKETEILYSNKFLPITDTVKTFLSA